MVRSASAPAELAGRLAAAAPAAAALPAHARAAILEAVSQGLRRRGEDFARLICREVGKPIRDARREVARAAFTFRWAAEEALRVGGEVMPLDLEPGLEGRLALTRRVSRGPALLIAPFNFPLNLVAHKVAPAVAVGAPFALKPASAAWGTAEALGRLLAEAGWPPEAMALVRSAREAEALARDEGFAVLSFTGSAEVGWRLKSLAGRKPVLLELGGNAGVYVAEDADLEQAAARCVWGAFCYAGQVCISVQRVFVARAAHERFRTLLLEKTAALKVGEPEDEATDVGPLITEGEAARVEAAIREAVGAGGRLLCGGERRGRFVQPAWLEGAPRDCAVHRDELFGPAAVLEPVEDAAEALERIDDSRYGLQAGIFTRDMSSVLRFWQRLHVGAVVVNDVPTFRCDAMPYGGTKDSGLGREGLRWAIEEFTEPRALVLRS